MNKWLLLVATMVLSSSTYAANMPTREEMWEMIQLQQKQIQALQAAAANTQKEIQAVDEKAEAAATIAEESSQQTGTGWWNKTSIGGYGEHHINLVNDGGDTSDSHRFVLFFGHEFTDDLRFFSEFELEHAVAGEGKDGEVELEQMYIEYDFNDSLVGKAGVMLQPIGIINETHEPPTFYGVERNSVENIIIPSTWWEAGGMVSGHFGNGLSWDVGLTSGLDIPASGSSTLRVRSGRGKSSKQPFNNRAAIGRIKYTGVPGLELAASLYHQSDMTQNSSAGIDSGTLFETHAIWNYKRFGLRALYAQWDFDATTAVATAASGKNKGDDQDGWYIEPSYKITDQFGIFARYEDIDGARASDEFDTTTVGFNYWLHDDVVLKADYQDQDLDGGTNTQVVNLGIGYQF